MVAVEHSGISTGTEKLLWTGRMPMFPGMGYPLVPGYESVGVVTEAGDASGHRIGDHVFVPGARCYGEVRGLFGGASSRVVVPGDKALTIDPGARRPGRAARARSHRVPRGRRGRPAPHRGAGADRRSRRAGRLLSARAHDGRGRLRAADRVGSQSSLRMSGSTGYAVLHPDDDPRRDYRSVYDVSGDASLLDRLIARIAKGGEVVLAGFYTDRLAFDFAPAFMREATIRTAAEWRRSDLLAVKELVESGRVSLDGLITHRESAERAASAYPTAFDDATCLKMILDWRACQ